MNILEKLNALRMSSIAKIGLINKWNAIAQQKGQ
jgi:hypothetical protein